MRYGIYTLIGTKKVLAAERNTHEEATQLATVLTESAESNPRNPSPLHWVEELANNWLTVKSNWECGICHDLQYGPKNQCPKCKTLLCRVCAPGHQCP